MASNYRLKYARKLRGWSQAKVAEQVGTDSTTVSRWERGLFTPTPYFREKLCILFGYDAVQLGLLDDARQASEEDGNDLPFQNPSILFSSAHVKAKGTQAACQAEPKSLTSQTCILESFGYRCDIRLWLSTSGEETSSWNWAISSTAFPAQLIAMQRPGQPGQPNQFTLYIHSTPGQQGQFTLNFTSSVGHTSTVVTGLG